jgi:hypothetical protein
MLKKLLEVGGKQWSDLPMMEGHVNLQTNKNTLCYNHVLGFCSGNRCRFKHVPKHQVTLEFAKRICQVVEPGARWLVTNETPAPGNTDTDTLGKREGLQGIHDIFPSNVIDSEDPISYTKILKGKGVWALQKDILGFMFDGDRTHYNEFLLTILQKWIRSTNRGAAPIPFDEFRSVISKLRHAFILVPTGVGLLSLCCHTGKGAKSCSPRLK